MEIDQTCMKGFLSSIGLPFGISIPNVYPNTTGRTSTQMSIIILYKELPQISQIWF